MDFITNSARLLLFIFLETNSFQVAVADFGLETRTLDVDEPLTKTCQSNRVVKHWHGTLNVNAPMHSPPFVECCSTEKTGSPKVWNAKTNRKQKI